MKHWFKSSRQCSGFALLELAVVLVVIGLLLAIGSSTLPWINEELSLRKTRLLMTEVSAALLAFSLTNNRLPCPADPALSQGAAGFGTEDCSRETGVVPHEALLLSAAVLDAYHRPIGYAVYRRAESLADLAVVTNLFDGLDEPNSVLNVLDYCRALQNLQKLEPPIGIPGGGGGNPGFQFASVATTITGGGCSNTTHVNQAIVLYSGGLEDADGNGDPFDGLNTTGATTCFASPQKVRSANYDDLVFGVSAATILAKVCPQGLR